MKTENKNGKEQHTAKASSQSLPVSTKQCMEVCRSIRYKTTTYAKKFLDEVLAHTKAVPFRYHNKDISHKPGIGAGRYPRKATEECIKLISKVESNAQFKGLNISNLKIIKLLANKGSIPLTGTRFRHSTKRTHLEIEVREIAAPKKEEKKESSEEKVKVPKTAKKSVKATGESQ